MAAKSARPATVVVTVNRPRNDDRLGGAIAFRATKFSPTFQAVFAGQRCLGHILTRGPRGLEAFDADDNAIGIFPTAAAAAEALVKLAPGGAA